MSSLKIINSPHSRIMTQCDHCQHLMKTTADALYYLVECPNCFKDFIVKRYREAKSIAPPQRENSSVMTSSSINVSDDAFIRAVYKLSWPIYKFIIAIFFVSIPFTYGLNGDIRILVWCISGGLGVTILHYFILCLGNIYFRKSEKH